MEEISAGGVVVVGDTVLTLRKYQGDWVLPKGRLEENESSEEAAIRAVSYTHLDVYKRQMQSWNPRQKKYMFAM